MDETDKTIIFVTSLFIIIAIIGSFYLVMTPIRNDNAQQECVNKGFETYVDYSNLFFQTKPVALVCGTYKNRLVKDKIIKEYITNNQSNIIVQETKN